LKKTTKKLWSVLASVDPERLRPVSQKVFWLFSSKKRTALLSVAVTSLYELAARRLIFSKIQAVASAAAFRPSSQRKALVNRDGGMNHPRRNRTSQGAP
jgi:hypothetical protein